MPAERFGRSLGSTSFRLALMYGVLIVAVTTIISAMFYLGTVGILTRDIDERLQSKVDLLFAAYRERGEAGVADRIQRFYGDGIDTDTEEYLLLDPSGKVVTGNIAAPPRAVIATGEFIETKVSRLGQRSDSRLVLARLPDGGTLAVGRDIAGPRRLRRLVWTTIGAAEAVSIILSVVGAVLFRRHVEGRIAEIRGTAKRIGDGDLNPRIPVSREDDEFSRLGADLNRMLDRIQSLMEGVRNVSNSIAHGLKTPLMHIRGRLEDALIGGKSTEQMRTALDSAIAGIDGLVHIFEKLLLIAEAEAGAQRRGFRPVDVRAIFADAVELYDALAEERKIGISIAVDGSPIIEGDQDLLAVAIANLLENALKYAGDGAVVLLKAVERNDLVLVSVSDDGPGIPAEERSKVVQRFYRLDTGRSLPGSGLGLSIVAAVVSLHGGEFVLEDARPGLSARMAFAKAGRPMSEGPGQSRKAGAAGAAPHKAHLSGA